MCRRSRLVRRANCPPETHEPYEQAIRDAGREVGHALLERKQFGQAWAFFRMLGEPEPVRAALEAYTPGPEDDVYPVIEIAWQNGGAAEEGLRPRTRPARRLFGHHDGEQFGHDRQRRAARLLRRPTGAGSARAAHRAAAKRRSQGAAMQSLHGRDHRADRRGAPRTLRRRLVPHRHVAPVERGADEYVPAGRAGERTGPRAMYLRPASCPAACKGTTIRRSRRTTTITWRS